MCVCSGHQHLDRRPPAARQTSTCHINHLWRLAEHLWPRGGGVADCCQPGSFNRVYVFVESSSLFFHSTALICFDAGPARASPPHRFWLIPAFPTLPTRALPLWERWSPSPLHAAAGSLFPPAAPGGGRARHRRGATAPRRRLLPVAAKAGRPGVMGRARARACARGCLFAR